jgi:hypothetical protein
MKSSVEREIGKLGLIAWGRQRKQFKGEEGRERIEPDISSSDLRRPLLPSPRDPALHLQSRSLKKLRPGLKLKAGPNVFTPCYLSLFLPVSGYE